jgi:hypothetical protein
MISEIIAQERKNLFDVSPSLLIEGPCRVGEGILNLLDTHLHFYESNLYVFVSHQWLKRQLLLKKSLLI